MGISLRNRQSALRIDGRLIGERAAVVLKALGRKGSGLTILIAGDQEIRRLNLEFRGKDSPTNVLAFPWEGPGPPRAPFEPDAGPAGRLMKGYLGDVALSADAVKREARELGLRPGYMLHFYLIHGILHLVGHDHEEGPEAEALQESETERLMGLIGHSLR